MFWWILLTCNVPWHKVLSKVLSKTTSFSQLGSVNWLFWISQKPKLIIVLWNETLNEKKWKSCFCFFTDGKQHKACKLDMITCDLECPWHANCIICSYDVTGADFKNSLYTFGQSEKSYRFQCIITKGNQSSTRVLCCLTVMTLFVFIQCIIKQLLDSVFVISRIIKVSVRLSASAFSW